MVGNRVKIRESSRMVQRPCRRIAIGVVTSRITWPAARRIRSERALYLGSTDYRIQGSNEPHTIGTAASAGCIRMTAERVGVRGTLNMLRRWSAPCASHISVATLPAADEQFSSVHCSSNRQVHSAPLARKVGSSGTPSR